MSERRILQIIPATGWTVIWANEPPTHIVAWGLMEERSEIGRVHGTHVAALQALDSGFVELLETRNPEFIMVRGPSHSDQYVAEQTERHSKATHARSVI